MNCPVCTHKAAQYIIDDIAQQKPDSVIEETFRLQPGAIAKHRTTCEAPPSLETIVADLASVVRIARLEVQRAHRSGDKDALLKYMSQLVRTCEVLGKTAAVNAFPKEGGVVVDARSVHIGSLATMSPAELRQAIAALGSGA